MRHTSQYARGALTVAGPQGVARWATGGPCTSGWCLGRVAALLAASPNATVPSAVLAAVLALLPWWGAAVSWWDGRGLVLLQPVANGKLVEALGRHALVAVLACNRPKSHY